MAYVDQGGKTNRTTAIAGVAFIHAAIGTILVVGLSTQIQEILAPPPPPKTFDVRTPPPPPPPDPKADIEQRNAQVDPVIFTPPVSQPLNTKDPLFRTSDVEPLDLGDLIKNIEPATGLGTGAGDGFGLDRPLPTPLFDPVSASPRNDTSRWVTTGDYRNSWINREMTGTARFTVTIGTNGKVDDCTIIASTGHTALDRATCKLVKQRAKFNPARDSNGDLTSGTFTKSVKWELPR